MIRQTKIFQDEDIRQVAPSVFSESAWKENSARYKFLPTISVVNTLREKGFHVVSAGQSRCRIEGKGEFVKHIIRMRHTEYINPINVGDEVPEIVIVNSHDRSSAYKFLLGIFRLVCSNGLIVSSATIESLNIRHIGDNNFIKDVIDISGRIVDETPKVFSAINRFKEIQLTQPEQLAFATSAREILPTSLEVKPEQLLNIRRWEDRGNGVNSLWKTSNIIQENIIKGGVLGINSKGERYHTRRISCIQNNVNVNKAIWKLTEEFAKIKV